MPAAFTSGGVALLSVCTMPAEASRLATFLADELGVLTRTEPLNRSDPNGYTQVYVAGKAIRAREIVRLLHDFGATPAIPR